MMSMSSANAVPLQIPARYMAVSILNLVIWIALAPWMLHRLMDAPLSYPVIAWTHLITIGVIGSMILGASVQMVPVALQVPFPALKLADASWYLWITGVILFEIGFAWEIVRLLVPGATLLGTVLIGYALAITAMVKDTSHLDAVSLHLLAASWFAVIGFGLGWTLALTNVNGVLGGRLLPILAAHIACMIIGWVTLTLLGVGYKLVGMFTLAERVISQTSARISGLLISIGTLALITSLSVGWNRTVVTIGAVLVAWGVLIAATEFGRMYDKRMRKAIDVHMPFAIAAIACMVIAAISLVIVTFERQPLTNPLTITSVWIALTGCFIVAIQGFFYKISTFLIWLHTYAPLAGKVAVPQLDTMYDRKLAYAGLSMWLAGVACIAAMLMNWLPVWRGWSLPLILGGVMFVINVARIARHWRIPTQSTAPAA